MQTKNKNVVAISCPPCGENVALATKRGAYKAISLMSPSIGPADHFLRKGGRLGFTLIELLVVVLIIGILAAVAVPQYQVAVAKARFTELKVVTGHVAKFAQLYYLEKGSYNNAAQAVQQEIPNTVACHIWGDEWDRVRCCKIIANDNVCLYFTKSTTQPISCLVYNLNKKTVAHKLCLLETGDSVPRKEDSAYFYDY